MLEKTFEKAAMPYFDGFTGANEPFFDPTTIANNDLPARWVRLWKLHGSLGWYFNLTSKRCVRSKPAEGVESTVSLIYPENLKYDHTQKLPYAAIFDRLKKFLSEPDTLLLSCGFSFGDTHISAVIEEGLSANRSASVFSFQYGKMEKNIAAKNLAERVPNMSVFAADKAIVNGLEAPWQPGELNREWLEIRKTYWNKDAFILGDFTNFCRFLVQSKATQLAEEILANAEVSPDTSSEKIDDSAVEEHKLVTAINNHANSGINDAGSIQ